MGGLAVFLSAQWRTHAPCAHMKQKYRISTVGLQPARVLLSREGSCHVVTWLRTHAGWAVLGPARGKGFCVHWSASRLHAYVCLPFSPAIPATRFFLPACITLSGLVLGSVCPGMAMQLSCSWAVCCVMNFAEQCRAPLVYKSV